MISVAVWTDALDQLIDVLPREVTALQGEMAERLKDTAKALLRPTLTDRATGETVEGIVTDYTDPEQPVVKTTAPQSIWVYLGSSRNRMAPRPFFDWAIQQEQSWWENEVGRLLERAGIRGRSG